MKRMKLATLFILSAFAILACSSNEPGTEVIPEPGNPSSFAKGADISWVTEMEKMGMKFYTTAGKETECFQLMKEIGMDAIRLRVWVNPEDGWCNKADVMAKARRAARLGMRLMIDFHYSDWWADPGKQNKPGAWKNFSLEELKQAVAQHTEEILKALKNESITPEWVQVGNETRNGMLWEDGRLWTEAGDLNHWSQYAALSNAGYDATKRVFPGSIVIIHIDNGWEDNDWWFKKFKAAGGKWDMIGLSHYPQTHASKTWEEMNNLCLLHIRSLSADYGCKVMICEVGVKQHDEVLAAKVLKQFMSGAKQIENCAGVFYWEPQVYDDWKPEIYESLGWNGYDMGAFTKQGRPAAALEAFK